jgi:hypothetical protein
MKVRLRFYHAPRPFSVVVSLTCGFVVTAVIHLADGFLPHIPVNFIEGLAAVRHRLGPETLVHFMFVSPVWRCVTRPLFLEWGLW